MTQEQAFEILKTGQSVFLTGSAGSGKTYLLNKYIDYLKAKEIKVGITASTGIASTHINGRTIHAWSGLQVIEKSLSRKEIDKKIKKLSYNESVVAAYRDSKVLIIDEVSMLDAEYLDLINITCQVLRQSVAAFGGIQVVLCGDFFQLPPISTSLRRTEYAYQADVWRDGGFRICYLDKEQRYIDDEFVALLNDIRNSRVSAKTVATLQSRVNQPVAGIVKPIRLYTKNINVDSYNNIELDNLKNKEEMFTMTTYFKEKEHSFLRDHLVRHCMAPYHLALRVGAVVMFVKNNFDESGVNDYVNGTMGKVVSFARKDGVLYPVVRVNDGREIVAYHKSWHFGEPDASGKEEIVASITQIPLRLAWAITVHKSQGLSMDEVATDLSGAFEYGMGYVALSRVRSLAGLCLLGFNQKALQVNPSIAALDSQLKAASASDLAALQALDPEELKKQQASFISDQGVVSETGLLNSLF